MRTHIIALAATLAAGLSILSPAFTAASAQSTVRRPDIVGVWKMDTTKFEKHDAALSGLTLNVFRRRMRSGISLAE